jgi:hypothetical protein
MLRNLIVMAVAVGLGGMVGSCGCDGTIVRPYEKPKVGKVVQSLKDRNAAARSFRAESTMDYWVGKERVKGTVQVQGRIDRRLRFNALNPGAGTVAIDLACDGTDFVYLNQNENCVLTGPCDATAIAQLLRIELEPEDFLLLAVGSTPILEGEAVLSWDDQAGREVVTITTADKRVQTIKLDGRSKEATWDVLESTVTGADGKVEWKLSNKDFKAIEVEGGGTRRVPGKTRFEQPPMKADLIVDWETRSVNLELAEEFFQLAPPAGLPQCGSK